MFFKGGALIIAFTNFVNLFGGMHPTASLSGFASGLQD